MRISDDVREIAVTQIEALLPGYSDLDQKTLLLEAVLSGRDGPERVASLLRNLATETDITGLSQLLPKFAERLGDNIDPVIDEVLSLASRAVTSESEALGAAVEVMSLLSPERADRVLGLAVEALLAGGDRTAAAVAVLQIPATTGLRGTLSQELDGRLLTSLERGEPSPALFDAVRYLLSRFKELPDEQQASFRKLLVRWLDTNPDYAEEVGRIATAADLKASQRMPLVKALLRAAENATQSSWRAEALQAASLVAGESRPARALVNTAIKRMLNSRDEMNTEAVAIAGLSLPA
jgi:hypothetical protein